jgi:hypothetical protein
VCWRSFEEFSAAVCKVLHDRFWLRADGTGHLLKRQFTPKRGSGSAANFAGPRKQTSGDRFRPDTRRFSVCDFMTENDSYRTRADLVATWRTVSTSGLRSASTHRSQSQSLRAIVQMCGVVQAQRFALCGPLSTNTLTNFDIGEDP